MKFIVLDSAPLGLLTQRPGARQADACRQWMAAKAAQGVGVIVPEIVDYELRRELIRSEKADSIRRLDLLGTHSAVTFLPITSAAMRLAAELWAKSRRQGAPTAHPHALDVDVILSAQILSAGYLPTDLVVATSNVAHLSLFVPANVWTNI